MSNTASILCLCISTVVLLVLQKAAAMPIAGHSGDGEPPTNLLDPSSEPTSPHLLEFQCTPTSAIGPECPSAPNQLEKLGGLQTGLDVLWDYTKELRNSWGPWTTACSSPVNHEFYGLVYYENIKHEHMAAWIGVFRAYGDHIQSLLEMNLLQTHRDTLETLYSVLTSVLEDYRDVMEPYFCGCGDFGIPNVTSRMPVDCLNVIYNLEYHLSHVSGDIARAKDVMTRWMDKYSVSSSYTPSEEEWIQQQEDVMDSPNYQSLLRLFAG